MTDTETTEPQQRCKPFTKGQSGNPKGRPIGARHKATLAAEALLDGEAEKLSRKAVELALAGDTVALRLCLERILPARKSVPVRVDLPVVEKPQDIVALHGALLQAAGHGTITPEEAATLGALGDQLRKAIEMQDIEQRLAAVEQQLTNNTGRKL